MTSWIKQVLEEKIDLEDSSYLTYFLGLGVCYTHKRNLSSLIDLVIVFVNGSGLTDEKGENEKGKVVKTLEMLGVKMRKDDGELLNDTTCY